MAGQTHHQSWEGFFPAPLSTSFLISIRNRQTFAGARLLSHWQRTLYYALPLLKSIPVLGTLPGALTFQKHTSEVLPATPHRRPGLTPSRGPDELRQQLQAGGGQDRLEVRQRRLLRGVPGGPDNHAVRYA